MTELLARAVFPHLLSKLKEPLPRSCGDITYVRCRDVWSSASLNTVSAMHNAASGGRVGTEQKSLQEPAVT